MLASQFEEAAENVKQDVDVLLKAFGINSVDDWNALGVNGQRKYHERFALKIPPAKALKEQNKLIVKTLLDEARRIAAEDRVGGNVPGNDGADGDNGAVADFDPGHDHALAADPDVVADDGVALSRQLIKMRGRALGPGAAHHVEWVRGDAAEPMVRRSHDELGARGDLAELADDEPVAEHGVIEENVVALKFRRIDRIVIVGVVADENIGRLHHILDEARGSVLVGKNGIGIGQTGRLLHDAGRRHQVLLGRAVSLQVRARRTGSPEAPSRWRAM